MFPPQRFINNWQHTKKMLGIYWNMKNKKIIFELLENEKMKNYFWIIMKNEKWIIEFRFFRCFLPPWRFVNKWQHTTKILGIYWNMKKNDFFNYWKMKKLKKIFFNYWKMKKMKKILILIFNFYMFPLQRSVNKWHITKKILGIILEYEKSKNYFFEL